MTKSLIAGIALLSVGTYLMRFAGAKLGNKIAAAPRVQAMLSDAAAILLFTVAVTATFYDSTHFSGVARVVGVGVALLLMWRKTPLIIVIIAAAAVTAILRQLGVA
ncbi:branched-chain amino acid transport [Salmonella enterica subsp. enterica serovar Choleraesuis]|nr:branched-chain amino acid transport [Salmonella enterica subsp. enterica serovar Choleraesuis]